MFYKIKNTLFYHFNRKENDARKSDLVSKSKELEDRLEGESDRTREVLRRENEERQRELRYGWGIGKCEKRLV